MVADHHEIELGNSSGVSEVVVQAALTVGKGSVAVHVAPEDLILSTGRVGLPQHGQQADHEG